MSELGGPRMVVLVLVCAGAFVCLVALAVIWWAR
jgi:hypothetical protein